MVSVRVHYTTHSNIKYFQKWQFQLYVCVWTECKVYFLEWALSFQHPNLTPLDYFSGCMFHLEGLLRGIPVCLWKTPTSLSKNKVSSRKSISGFYWLLLCVSRWAKYFRCCNGIFILRINLWSWYNYYPHFIAREKSRGGGVRDAFSKLPEVTQVMYGQVGIWTEAFKSRVCALSHYYIVQLASPQPLGLNPAVSFCALWHRVFRRHLLHCVAIICLRLSHTLSNETPENMNMSYFSLLL